MISVIIPVLNEARNLPATLARLSEVPGCEIIVVDGGSHDHSVQIAKEAGCRLLSCPPGRGAQLNLGAAAAGGEILIFLHADTTLPPGFPALVEKNLARPQVVAGAFSLSLEGSWWGLKLVAWGANLRSRRLQLPYGDQALFLRRSSFLAHGPFPEQEILEDLCLVRRLTRHGRVVTLEEKVISSGRRWQERGIMATISNQLILLGYLLGLPANVLAKFYRGVKGL
ncbi:MAG: TIGR04283 family arsenosugar biosynthesis glycosyltransferase [Thermodesulfobacteriota bacterium]